MESWHSYWDDLQLIGAFQPMKIFFTLICLFCASITLVLGQGAEGFNKFRDKSPEFNSGSFVGENGINWNYVLSRNISIAGDGGFEKSRLEMNNDTTAEISSSVISGGIGLLKIDYSTLSSNPVKLDVYVNSVKVATLNSPSSETVVTVSSDNIAVNIDKPFYIRIKQSDETSGQVIIEKVLWSQFSSTDYGVLSESYIPAGNKEILLNTGMQSDYSSSYHIYPNPAKDFVLIEMTENHTINFKLFTLAGQVVLQEQVKNSGQKINISNLKEGLYIYKILDEKGKLVTGKLIIK
jgi:hypothetical protein